MILKNYLFIFLDFFRTSLGLASIVEIYIFHIYKFLVLEHFLILYIFTKTIS